MREDGPPSGVDAMKWKSQAKIPWIRRGYAGAGVGTVIQFTLGARGLPDNTPVSRPRVSERFVNVTKVSVGLKQRPNRGDR